MVPTASSCPTVLSLLRDRAGREAAGVREDEWCLHLPGRGLGKPEWLTPPAAAALAPAIATRIAGLERTLARPRANERLPLSVRVDEVRAWLSLEEELSAIDEAVLVKPADDVTARLLRGLASLGGS